MPLPTHHPVALSKARARRIWLRSQKLDAFAPFGEGAEATHAAVEHLGYVQIDTINVIERCHHHILYTRIPAYRREDLRRAQSVDKTVFEYRAHALAYLPTKVIRFCIGDMRKRWRHRNSSTVNDADLRKLVSRITKQGALTLRDIDDDVLIDKTDGWASRKPSERALRLAFYGGRITVSERVGILKTYELMSRHFGWAKPPSSASHSETLNYLLDRALRSQGAVSLASICHLDAPRKPAMTRLIEARVRRKELVQLNIEGAEKQPHWALPEALDATSKLDDERVHILSPFDPLVIQRRRLKLFFDYEHIFEAYVPRPKRRYGYFALPVLAGDKIVAAIDLKTDRERGKLLVKQWTWLGSPSHKTRIETELHRFEQFQLAK